MAKTLEELDREAKDSFALAIDYPCRLGKLHVGWWPDGNVYFLNGQRITRDQAKEAVDDR